MRLTTIILITAILQVSAASYGQKITLSEKNAQLVKVFDQISAQSGFDFLVSASILKDSKRVRIQVKNMELSDVLDQLFEGRELKYSIEDKSVVVSKKEKGFFDKVVARFQAIDVGGRVVDENGSALAGATITVKGKNQSVISGANGVFMLKDVDENAILIITFIGFQTKEVKAESGLGNVTLLISDSKLEEIQVIAYGVVSKKFSTSNIGTISAEDIAKQPVSNPLLALQGRVPGLFIQQNSGATASNVSVNIQGLNSIQSGVNPFYVIDGVPYTPNFTGGNLMGDAIAGGPGTFNFINPADIENISILKDADATAIYGSRAANGAILITTKKGKPGKTRADVNFRNGWGKIDHRLNMLNTQQYLEMRKEAYMNAGRAVPNSTTNPDDTNYDLTVWDQNRFTDWQKVLVGGTAQFTDAQASLSGGNENTQFMVGYNYNRQTTVYPNSLADVKGNIHFSLNNTSLNTKFKYLLTANYLQNKNQLNQTDLMNAALTLAPNAPQLYQSDGTLNLEPLPNDPERFSFNNPLSATLRRFTGNTNNLIGNNTISYEILPGLQLKSSVGYNKLETDEISIVPSTVYPPNYPTKTRFANYLTKSIISWIVEPQLTYVNENKFGRFDLLLGGTFQENKNDALSQSGQGYSTDAQLENLLSATAVTVNSFLKTQYRYNAIFGRMNYRLYDKYIFNFTLRRDGTSRFGEDRKFNNFYSIGGAWLFGDESAIKGIMPWLSLGKLRANYGTTGNDQILDYAYLSTLSNYGGDVGADIPYQGIVSLYPTNISNPLLRWEETRKLNLGLDLGFLKNRISASINWYRNRSSNQLVLTPLPYTTGFPYIQQNFPATVQNEGFEVQLDASILKSKKLNWHSSLNFTANRNKLIAYEGLQESTAAFALLVGQPINIIHAYKYAGVNANTGLYEFINSKGEKTSSPNSETDRSVLINPNPKWFGGFVNSFQYGGLQLDFLLQYVSQRSKSSKYGNYPSTSILNQPISILKRWKNAGDNSEIQKYSNRTLDIRNPYRAIVESDANYTDGSYLRLKNVSLSYTLSSQLLSHVKVSSAKLYVQGQNLLTITKFIGADPETRFLLYIPPLRVFTLGLQVGI